MTETDGLRREIGVWGLASNSINIVIGAGIFIMPAIVAERLGAASILAYAICGVLQLVIMHKVLREPQENMASKQRGHGSWSARSQNKRDPFLRR